MSPVIGIIPLYDEKKNSYWMLPGYMEVVERCGGLPLMLPLTSDPKVLEQIAEQCDGFLFTGGHDVNPAVYGEKPSKECGLPCDERDLMEGELLKIAMRKDLPVFGICRGIQFINAYLGGTLYQDLETEHKSNVDHHMTPPYDRPVHSVEVVKDTLLAHLIGEGVHQVNSYHHQAIKQLSDQLEAMAYSEDHLVEAVSVKGKKFIVAVQWHPEFSYKVNNESVKLVQAFVDACC